MFLISTYAMKFPFSYLSSEHNFPLCLVYSVSNGEISSFTSFYFFKKFNYGRLLVLYVVAEILDKMFLPKMKEYSIY